jgi:hypothetical protein
MKVIRALSRCSTSAKFMAKNGECTIRARKRRKVNEVMCGRIGLKDLDEIYGFKL